MSYSYYQQSGTPGWGTTQFQFGAPPAPTFQPQPTWGGHDFFRAHAGNSVYDPTLFDHAWNRVRDHQDHASGGVGAGLHEARIHHRRVYGGLGDFGQMLPSEIGHAAAYEAYRSWIHNSSIREPLSGDLERQREGLAGMAVAEASRLLQYSTRPMDSYARMEASEAAATTASILFYSGREHDNEEFYRGRSSSRHESYADYDDPYALDGDALYSRHRPRSHSRHHSSSRARSTSHHRSMMGYPMSGVAMSHGSVMQAGGVPMQGVPSAVHGAYGGGGSIPYGSYPAAMMAGRPASHGAPQYAGNVGVPMQYQHSMGGVPMALSAQSMGGVPMAMSAQSYATSLGVPMQAHHRGRSNSFSVPYGTQYAPSTGQQYMVAGVPQSQAVMVSKSHKKHRDHSKHRSKRSKSSEPRYITY